MKKLTLAFAALALSFLAVADSATFTKGDYIFVKAQIVGCGPADLFVEGGQVTDTGQVTLFNTIQLEVEGMTTSVVSDQLVDALEQQTARRPKTIKVIRVAEDDSRKAALMMMAVLKERSGDCDLEAHPQDFPGWIGEFQLASRLPLDKPLATDIGDTDAG